MSKFWDIIPPSRPTRHVKHFLPPKKSKNAPLFFGLVMIILAGVFIYSAFQNTPVDVDGVATTSPQKSTANQKPLSLPTEKTEKSPDQLLIKILNGTGRSEETSNMVDILENLGFKVTKTENALNLYDQTIVYFESHQEESAQKIAKNLAKYQAKAQPLSQESPYDVIIVIGAR